MENYEKKKNIDHLFNGLNSNNIRYALIKNINNELPGRLVSGKDIDILVNGRDKNQFRKVMQKMGRRFYHPYCREKGWENLYGLPQFEMWRMFHGENLLVDVTYRLCCRSITPMKWVPLDESIQTYAWENVVYDRKNKWWTLDDNMKFVYYIVRSVFDKGGFSDLYIMEIQALKSVVDVRLITDLLKTVFFEFTPHLLERIWNDDYKNIRDSYIAFIDY